MKRIVIGMGMAGCNFISRNLKSRLLTENDVVAIDCDEAFLSVAKRYVKTMYYSDPTYIDEGILEELKNYDQILFVVGLGGRSGDFIISLIKELRDMNKTVIGSCIVPYRFETDKKEKGAEQLEQIASLMKREALIIYESSLDSMTESFALSRKDLFETIDEIIIERLVGKLELYYHDN